MTAQSEPSAKKKSTKPRLTQILKSVLGGALGVQSHRQHQADFQGQSPWPYILAGVLFTLSFIAVLVLVVQWVLASRVTGG